MISLAAKFFNEEETVETTKLKFEELLSSIDYNLFEQKDYNNKSFLDYLIEKNQFLIEDNYGEFLNKMTVGLLEKLCVKNDPDNFDINLLSEELSYGWVISIAIQH